MYFADNRQSYVGETPYPVKVCRFDVESKTVDLSHEITESPLSPLSEIIQHGEELYVRNANDELFIFHVGQ